MKKTFLALALVFSCITLSVSGDIGGLLVHNHSSAAKGGSSLAPTSLTVPSGTTLPTPTLTGTMTATGATISGGTFTPTSLTVPSGTNHSGGTVAPTTLTIPSGTTCPTCTLTGTTTNSGTISGGTINPTTLQVGGVNVATVQASAAFNLTGTAVTGNMSSVDQSTDIVTWSTTHGLTSGDVIYVTGGTWPNVGGTQMVGGCYVNAVNTTTFTCHSTYAAAIAGTSPYNFNSNGSGTRTAAVFPPTNLRSVGLATTQMIRPTGLTSGTVTSFTGFDVVFASNLSNATYSVEALADVSGTVTLIAPSARAVGSVSFTTTQTFGAATSYFSVVVR